MRPGNICAARKLPVALQISEALVRRMECAPYVSNGVLDAGVMKQYRRGAETGPRFAHLCLVSRPTAIDDHARTRHQRSCV